MSDRSKEDRKRAGQSSRRKSKHDDSGGNEEEDDRRNRKKDRHNKKEENEEADASDSESSNSSSSSSSSSETDSSEERGRRRRKRRRQKERKRKKEKRKRKHKESRRRRRRDDRDSDSEEESSDDDSRDDGRGNRKRTKYQADKATTTTDNPKLLAKLQARGETLEERKERRAARAEQKRAAFIATKFGYTADDNPFHDPNLHQAFTWTKKKEQDEKDHAKKLAASAADVIPKAKKSDDTATLDEIEKLRQRRKQRELQLEEMERIRREESRMKELENFDEWARKEEDFHLQQQRQRSAIRLVQGREKPIDVLAKNMLLFGVDKENRAAVKYQERYNALQELSETNLDVELEEPHKLLRMLKLHELEEVLHDINAFLTLEQESANDGDDTNNPILIYWLALKTVALDEIKYLKSGGEKGDHAKTVKDVCKIFNQGQSTAELEGMKMEISQKLQQQKSGDQTAEPEEKDADYWQTVLQQLEVYLAKQKLSEIHSEMLARQLERLEQKRQELAKMTPEERERRQQETGQHSAGEGKMPAESQNEDDEDGIEENDMAEEVEVQTSRKTYSWTDKFRPRKPRYFNRVKTGYDWNKYNKTHYDRDNPPPKTVQGYKFNIFYPDLIDPSKTPQFKLLKADSDEFCIIRFSAGPPYEDVAFKIVNREWNKSRKHGFKSTFERGILSLYFNFKTHWYRR